MMSTVLEIKQAIESLPLHERAELESLLWPDTDTPPQIRAKLQEAAEGTFERGDRSNIQKILGTLE